MSDNRGSTATPERGRSGSERKSGDRLGFFAKIALFYRQVIAELRKVVWPTQRELITYTTDVKAIKLLLVKKDTAYIIIFKPQEQPDQCRFPRT